MKKTLIAAIISVVLSVIITTAGIVSASFGTDGHISDGHISDGHGMDAHGVSAGTADVGTEPPETAADSGAYIPGGIFDDIVNVRPDVKRLWETVLCADGETPEETKMSLPSTDTEPEETAPAETEAPWVPAYPDDSMPLSLLVNGNELTAGLAARMNGTAYLPLGEFCALFSEVDTAVNDGAYTVSGNGFEVTAAVGDSYITSRGRVLWCGADAAVSDIGGTVCVPAEPLCRALGLELSDNGDGLNVSGDASSKSADEVYDADSLYWLSHIISAESRGEPLEGQIAVGCVVLNRLSKLDYLSSVYDVVFDRRYGIQFSPAYSGSVYSEPTESCVRAAKICLEGYTVSDSILYFINSADTPPTWMTRGCTLIVTIGHHDFYA